MHHTFDIAHAATYGLQEAIMITNFEFWIAKNHANGIHQHDGKTWTYNTIKAFAELFPYFTENQLRRTLESLVDKDVLVKGNYNESGYDRTSWYAFSNSFKSQIDLANLPNGSGKKAKPLISTDINADINTDVLAFEQVWAAYPDRPGKSKAASLKAWSARIKAGCTPREMMAGVIAYAAYCKASRTEPGYIKQPATFFGPDLHFRSEWKVPASRGGVPNLNPGDSGEIPDAE